MIHNQQLQTDIQTDRYLEVAAVTLPEGQDKAFEDQLSNLGELGVDDGDDGGVNMSKGRRRRLSLQHRASQQTPDRQTRTQSQGTSGRQHLQTFQKFLFYALKSTALISKWGFNKTNKSVNRCPKMPDMFPLLDCKCL